ncbi:MAG TPA: sulfatase-like hydrolase/transferase [Clostridiales bacterium]|nr:sulfatase-like hydrolase/transferase [Clostridiales bacterium]
MGRKPNIIIINPDEMRWDTMGHMGNEAAYTPHLDRFARTEAVSFENAYCQNPVCVPSRCSFSTGLYPHVRGHRTMAHLLHEDETSLFQELKNAGYYVWMNSRNDLVAGQIEGLVESHADEIYYYDVSKPAELMSPEMLGGMSHQKEEKYPYSHFKGVKEIDKDKDMQDTGAAIERILHPVEDKPLCLFLGLVNPHPPYMVEQKYYDKIQKSKMKPRVKLEETKGKSKMIETLHHYVGMDDFAEEAWQELRAIYLAQCAKVDDIFGKICDALKEAGIYDDSAIFVLSDHGDFAGDFGLPEKAQNSFEDCLTKVPLLIKPPKDEKVDPGNAQSIVELVDFYATAMDYAQVEPTHDHFGISLRKVIENRENKVRDYAFCEGGRLAHEFQCDECHSEGQGGHPKKEGDYWAKKMAQSDPEAHEKGTMIFDGRYKYVERLSGRNEFYDLEADPGERFNIYEDNKNSDMVQSLKTAMLKWYQATCDIVPRTFDSRFAKEYIWGIARSFCPPQHEELVKEQIRKGMPIGQVIPYAVGLLMKENKKK